MRKYMFIPILCLTLMASTCQNENDSHYYITFKNQSDSDIVVASLGSFPPYYKCCLDLRFVLEKNSVFEWQPFNWNIERILGRGSKTVLELYFVNPNKFNTSGFNDCDSIYIENDILAYYKLTLADLQRMNFTVVYPPEE